MKTIRDVGLILRRIDYGEADRIMTFLTRDHGKVQAIAKGVRKQKSKLAGGIELFSVSEVQLIQGRGEIDTLMSARLVRHYDQIVKDIDRTDRAYKFLKIIDKTVEDRTGQEYFDILDQSLSALNNSEISTLMSELSFMSRTLRELGHLPDFSTDLAGKALDQEANYQFDYESVSFAEHPDGAFDKNHIKVLRVLSLNDAKIVNKITGINKYCEDIAPLVRSLAANYISQ